jgi:hypothetical protein
VVKVVLDVPDAERLQLLTEALRLAADVRARAVGHAARDVLDDTAIPDKRADATRLLRVAAAADWLARLADGIPLFVVDDITGLAIGASPVYPSVPGTASGAPIAGVDAEALAAATRAAAATPPPPTADEAAQAAANAALRALTVPPNARLRPGDPPVTDPATPPALLDAAGASPGGDDV